MSKYKQYRRRRLYKEFCYLCEKDVTMRAVSLEEAPGDLVERSGVAIPPVCSGQLLRDAVCLAVVPTLSPLLQQYLSPTAQLSGYPQWRTARSMKEATSYAVLTNDQHHAALQGKPVTVNTFPETKCSPQGSRNASQGQALQGNSKHIAQ